ncbi:MAG: hypothetical protein ACAH83_09320 [Alphaproteobacteria bacterium]
MRNNEHTGSSSRHSRGTQEHSKSASPASDRNGGSMPKKSSSRRGGKK